MSFSTFRRQFGPGHRYPNIKFMDMGVDDGLYDDLDYALPSDTSLKASGIAETLSSQMSKLSMLENTHIKPYYTTESPSNKINDLELPTFMLVVDKKTRTKQWEAMDILLDKLMKEATESVKDKCKNINEEAVANAMASGVKVRDFAMTSPPSPSTVKPSSTTHTSEKQRPGLFPARERAGEFLYMRHLIKRGIYDLSNMCTAADDLDRLYTCGFVKAEDLDHPFLEALLAHGAYRRSLSSSGRPTPTGKTLPPRGPWTVLIDARRPSKKTMDRYIVDREAHRTNPKRMDHRRRVTTLKRSTLIQEYIDNHAAYLRFDKSGDGPTIGFNIEKDSSFIRPEVAFAKVKQPSEAPEKSVPAKPRPASEPSAIIPCTPASSSPCETANQLPSPTRGRSSDPDSKGQKRVRSPSVGHDNIASSRTRVRLSRDFTTPSKDLFDFNAEHAVISLTSEVTGRQHERKISISSSASRGLKRVCDEREYDLPTTLWATKKLRAETGTAIAITEPSNVNDIPARRLPSGPRVRRRPKGTDRARNAFSSFPKGQVMRSLTLALRRSTNVRVGRADAGVGGQRRAFPWPQMLAGFCRATAVST